LVFQAGGLWGVAIQGLSGDQMTILAPVALSVYPRNLLSLA